MAKDPKPLKPKRSKNLTRVVSVAPFNQEGMLLFGLRRDDNTYNLPGGHLEGEEDPTDGAKRELLEETGLETDSIEFIGQSDVVGRSGKDVTVYSFVCDVGDREPTGEDDPDQECSVWRYVEPDDVPEEILNNLHSKQDVTLTLLGIQSGELKKSDWEAGAKPILVQHISDVDKLETLDPAFQGTGSAGEEKNRTNRIPRLYLYTRPGEPKGDVSGRYLYHGELPIGTKLYDIHQDRHGFLNHKFVQTKHGQVFQETDLDSVERKLKKLGYHGYHSKSNQRAGVCRDFGRSSDGG
jgi:ADP-ribose pyrophosphatase YjhB (NUDIX family)